jgi:hypothetical protein
VRQRAIKIRAKQQQAAVQRVIDVARCKKRVLRVMARSVMRRAGGVLMQKRYACSSFASVVDARCKTAHGTRRARAQDRLNPTDALPPYDILSARTQPQCSVISILQLFYGCHADSAVELLFVLHAFCFDCRHAVISSLFTIFVRHSTTHATTHVIVILPLDSASVYAHGPDTDTLTATFPIRIKQRGRRRRTFLHTAFINVSIVIAFTVRSSPPSTSLMNTLSRHLSFLEPPRIVAAWGFIPCPLLKRHSRRTVPRCCRQH